MKKFFILSAAIFLAVSVAASAAQNLLPNSSFEEPNGAVGENPSEWWSWNSDYNGITTDAKKTGKQAIYLGPYSSPDDHGGILYRYENVKPGKSYVFSCYVINSMIDPMIGDAYGQISIEWRKDDEEIDRTWGPAYGAEVSLSVWKLVALTAVAPPEADSCNFVIQLFNREGQGSYYADDATAEEE